MSHTGSRSEFQPTRFTWLFWMPAAGLAAVGMGLVWMLAEERGVPVLEAQWPLRVTVASALFAVLAVSFGFVVWWTTRQMRKLSQELREQTSKASEFRGAEDRFLATMNHEIRTPLNSVLGLLTAMKDSELTPRLREYVGRATTSAEHLLDLLSEVLDLADTESGIVLEAAPFNLADVFRRLERLLTELARDKVVAVSVLLSPNVPVKLLGDSRRLYQVLKHLGDNAVKFTSIGTVKVSADLEGTDHDVVTVKFSVIDTGIGIAPEVTQKLFAGFLQADGGTARRFGGVGLGLVLAQRLVRLMGGKLEVQSKPGEGSRFFFTVALLKDHIEDLEVLPPQLDGYSILVVEDNPFNRFVAQELLQAEGAQVTLAESGIQALEALDHASFSVILMDLQMPDMDGYETARRIRERHPAVPILALTANTQPADRARCLSSGMGHIGKPLNVAALLKALKRIPHKEN